jgi:hypothetical protein
MRLDQSTSNGKGESRAEQSVGFGIAGLVCGILSVLLFWTGFIAGIVAIMGVVFGFLQLSRGPKGLGIGAIIVSLVALGIIIAVLVGFLLVSSFLLASSPSGIGPQLNDLIYNGVTFYVDQGQQLYVYHYNGIEHRTAILPQEVESIPVPQDLINAARSTSQITIVRSSAPDSAIALSTFLLSESLIGTGSYDVVQAYSDLDPQASCADASAQNVVLVFELSNKTLVSYEDSCATIEYVDQHGVIETKNAVLYRIMGIITE